MKVAIANKNLVNLKIFNRLYLSDNIPPSNENKITGVRLAVITNPSNISESVKVRINHNLPYTSDHIPILENKAASQKRRYSLNLNE